MFVLRPSSPFKRLPLKVEPVTEKSKEKRVELDAEIAVSEAKKAPSIDAEPLDGEPFVDVGLPIPDSYETDILRALIQDPFRIFIYWDVKRDHLNGLTQFFSPADINGFRTVLKLRDMMGGQEAFFDVDRSGRYWMSVFPDREYQFEIGVRSPLHGYIALLSSNRIHTPRGTISSVTADDEEYRLQPREFIEVMEKSGFGAEQSLDITVAAMPGVDVHENLLSETLNKFSDGTREAIMRALSGGKLTAELIADLPETIRAMLMDLLVESNGELAAAGLMHYMPELLRETIEDEQDWISDHVHPLHMAPRFFIGASEKTKPEDQELLFPAPNRPASERKYHKPVISFGSTLRQLLLQIG